MITLSPRKAGEMTKGDTVQANVTFWDKELLDSAKERAVELGYKSLSNYVSSILELDLRNDIAMFTLLCELKKYYENKDYSMSKVADRTGIDVRQIYEIMGRILRFRYVDNEKENLNKINRLLTNYEKTDHCLLTP